MIIVIGSGIDEKHSVNTQCHLVTTCFISKT